MIAGLANRSPGHIAGNPGVGKSHQSGDYSRPEFGTEGAEDMISLKYVIFLSMAVYIR
jgi:hypothetical protein